MALNTKDQVDELLKRIIENFISLIYFSLTWQESYEDE